MTTDTLIQEGTTFQFEISAQYPALLQEGCVDFVFGNCFKSMTDKETSKFLNRPTKKIAHLVLESTLYDPRLEQRIL